MDISAFPQSDKITETFAAQNALIQQLQRENTDLKQQLAEAQRDMALAQSVADLHGKRHGEAIAQLATAQAEVERLRKTLKSIADYNGLGELWMNIVKTLQAMASNALSAPQPDVKDKLASIHKRMENVTQGDVDAALEFTVDMSDKEEHED